MRVHSTKLMRANRLSWIMPFSVLPFFIGIICCRPTPPDCKAYAELSYEKQRKIALGNPVEKNFDLLRCRNYIEGFVGPQREIIEGGEMNAPFLISKMRESRNEFEQEDAIFLITALDERGHLPNRTEVIGIIEDVISRMKTVKTKDFSMERLIKMKNR